MCIAVIATFIATPSSGAASDSLPLTTAPVLTDLTPRAHKVAQTECSARKALRYYRTAFLSWREKMGGSFVSEPMMRPRNCVEARWLAKRWRERARIARSQFEHWYALVYEKWRCIHEHEGAWNSNTGNGYWGGLQMDWGFMHTYGPEFYRRYGTADRWPVWAQLITAERAWRTTGFRQWGTRRMCGL